jgi:hypothetical protein
MKTSSSPTPCPNCGRCPTCGHIPGVVYHPLYPYTPFYQFPYQYAQMSGYLSTDINT